MVWVIVGLVVVWIVWMQVRRSKRLRARRNSLHQDGTGYWLWVDFDGETHRSRTHPDEPGGAWNVSSRDGGGGGSDGGFFGGDGGGDGGGGGD